MVSEIENLKEYLKGEIDYYSNNKKEERKDRQEIIGLLKDINRNLNITVNYERAEAKAEV